MQGTSVEVKCGPCGRRSFINKAPVQGALRQALVTGQKCPACGAEFIDEVAAEEAAKVSHETETGAQQVAQQPETNGCPKVHVVL